MFNCVLKIFGLKLNIQLYMGNIYPFEIVRRGGATKQWVKKYFS